jgi:glycosyltransferase involved in cell wall biosynthesis
VVPDCVNGDVFRPGVLSPDERQALKASLGIPAHQKVVAYLGLLADYQGTGLLLEAAAEITRLRSDVHFLIMGYPGVDTYLQRAEQLGVREFTTFTGKIDYLEAPRYLALGDVAVVPKLSATEGVGKVLNYMAMALPTVAFDTEVSREYLGDTGAYAVPGDVHDLARALLAVLDDLPRAQQDGAALRRRVLDTYTWQNAGRDIVDIYNACLA